MMRFDGGRGPALAALLAWLALALLAPLDAGAGDQPQGGQEERGYQKKITVACIKDGAPVSPCDVVFTARHANHGARCVTASSGICQVLLMCCKHPGGSPLDWDITATTLWGIKKGSTHTSCSWMCDQADYIRFDFTGMDKK